MRGSLTFAKRGRSVSARSSHLRDTRSRTPCTYYISSTPPLAGLPHGVSRMVLALHLLGEAEPVHPSEHFPHARQPNIEHVPAAPG